MVSFQLNSLKSNGIVTISQPIVGLICQFIDEKASTRAGHNGVVVGIDRGRGMF